MRQTKRDWMKIELPYGVWLCADGRQVLFNRWYRPIYQKYPEQEAKPADPEEWVKFIKQEWFYKDGSTPWDHKATRVFLNGILALWGISPPGDQPRYKPNTHSGYAYRPWLIEAAAL